MKIFGLIVVVFFSVVTMAVDNAGIEGDSTRSEEISNLESSPISSESGEPLGVQFDFWPRVWAGLESGDFSCIDECEKNEPEKLDWPKIIESIEIYSKGHHRKKAHILYCSRDIMETKTIGWSKEDIIDEISSKSQAYTNEVLKAQDPEQKESKTDKPFTDDDILKAIKLIKMALSELQLESCVGVLGEAELKNLVNEVY